MGLLLSRFGVKHTVGRRGNTTAKLGRRRRYGYLQRLE